MRQKNANRERSNVSAVRPYSATLRQVGSSYKSMPIHYHFWRPYPTLVGQLTIKIEISGGVTEPEESADTVGDDFEGVDEDGSNSAGLWDDV